MRKGFTLVELLIVIVIIGILAAAMLLSSGSATASATASAVISDLRSLKAACLMAWADSMDYYQTAAPQIGEVSKFMDNSDKVNNGKYSIVTSGGKWYVKYDATSDAPEVREKLQGKAGSVGLLASTTSGDTYAGGNDVVMIAR